MNVGSLFAGIGGFDLGFERAGMRTVWQVEKDPYCRAVLARHFPDAERFEDVRDVGVHNLKPVHVLCAGFPCQPVSRVGLRLGTADERWLWPEVARIAGELRPRFIVLENVPGLLTHGMGVVLGDLAALGYDAEWDCLSAAAFGAPHIRDRVWIVAYPSRDAEAGSEAPARSERERVGPSGESVPDSGGARLEGIGSARAVGNGRGEGTLADAGSRRHRPRHETIFAGRPSSQLYGAWPPEPDVGRVADGVPSRVDRLAALGNSLVRQIPEWIGHRLMAYEAAPPRTQPHLLPYTVR